MCVRFRAGKAGFPRSGGGGRVGMVAPVLVGGHAGFPDVVEGLEGDLLFGGDEIAATRQTIIAQNVRFPTRTSRPE